MKMEDTAVSAWGEYVRRMRSLGLVPLVALLIVTVFISVAVFSNVISPHSPNATSLPSRLKPPAWDLEGSWTFLLGTDQLGRDILSRIIAGSRTSLLVALQALFLGAGLGGLIGIASGYFGGWVDTMLMRFADVMLALPIILFALLFVVISEPSTTNVIVAIGLVLWARFSRVIRGQVLVVREQDFVALARVAGLSNFRIIIFHILPNIANTLMVLASLQVGWVIVVEASLSFLGAGIPPPTAVWGSMIADGRNYITTAWWITFWPGLAVMMVVLAFNLFGDWLRDTLDPKLRQL